MSRAYRAFAFPSLARLRAAEEAENMAGLLDTPLDSAQELQRMEDARREGHEAGVAQGYRDGLAAGGERAQTLVADGLQALSAPLEALIAGLHTLQQQQRDALRQELAPLVEQVARKVVRAELELHPERLLAFVDEALAALPSDDEHVEVRLHPDEYRRISNVAAEQAARWQLRPDERLAKGECRIKAGPRELDAGCDQRLAACMEQLHALLEPGQTQAGAESA
ncbi:FliH/SctL family protein [Xanthomonas campestris pv. phormiicola]|nr:hypothetical protein [Xanthomonas campestris pv. phormiicola]UYC17875.1 FliH/SctL family protein [Xanthomonas campestris pv. phormiicola]